MILRALAILLTVWGTFSFCQPRVMSQEWTRFRGPNGSGISDSKKIPISWTEEDYDWKIKLPGIGHSSPVIWQEKLFITSADVATGVRYLQCIDTADGSEIWRTESSFQKGRLHNNNSFASNTPAVEANRVYLLQQSSSASPLTALDHLGNQVWQYDLGPYKHGQGPGTSPIVHEDLVIVSNDHGKGSFLLALNKRDGRLRWKIDRLGNRACYSTPCIFRPKDRAAEIIFTHCFEGIIGVDPKTGKQNWMIDVFGTFPQRAVGSPVVAGDLVIGNSGARFGGKNVVAVLPKITSSGISVREVYRISKSAPHVPTTLVYRDRLYLWDDAGIVTCLEVDSGRIVWQERVGGNFFGSPVCVDGRLYCVDLEGDVVVLAASDEFEILARNSLGSPSRATPAISGGRMFLRTFSHLFSIGEGE